jgi:hypothetical protein
MQDYSQVIPQIPLMYSFSLLNSINQIYILAYRTSKIESNISAEIAAFLTKLLSEDDSGVLESALLAIRSLTMVSICLEELLTKELVG